jgi:alpha-mannosidase
VIVRLYEAWGGRCAARLSSSLPFSKAALTDLLERETGELGWDGDGVRLHFDPFKILTVRLDA